MEAKGLQNDPRYNQLVYLRSKHTANSEAQVYSNFFLMFENPKGYLYFRLPSVSLSTFLQHFKDSSFRCRSWPIACWPAISLCPSKSQAASRVIEYSSCQRNQVLICPYFNRRNSAVESTCNIFNSWTASLTNNPSCYLNPGYHGFYYF
jgi:hypothetical protein